MRVVEKPKFVYTGDKTSYSEKWYHINDGYTAETVGGTTHWIVKTGGERIDCYYGNPNDLIEYVRRRIVVGGDRVNPSGTGRVYIKDAKTQEEICVLRVDKFVHRYYEPVTRFDHSKDRG